MPSFRLCSLHILSFTFLFSGWRRTGAYIWDHSSRCHEDWASAQPWLVNPRWAPLTKGENGRWQEPGHHFENPQGLRGWLGRGHTPGWRRRRGGRGSYVRHWRRKCTVFSTTQVVCYERPWKASPFPIKLEWINILFFFIFITQLFFGTLHLVQLCYC